MLNFNISTQEADLTICIVLIILKKSGAKISKVLNSQTYISLSSMPATELNEMTLSFKT